jgi:hypothetical protein
MAVDNHRARSFVNRIINGYDRFCHRDTPNIPDVFNPGLEEGLKENSLSYFAERFSNPPAVTAAELDAEVVALYKESAPTLSHMFALTGLLEAPVQDASLQQTQLRIIEAVAQDHLRKKGYELDPIASRMPPMDPSRIQMCNLFGLLPSMGTLKNPLQVQACNLIGLLPLFSHKEKRCFYAEVFQEVFSRCCVKNKKEIIKRLQRFDPILNTWSAQLQRVCFKVEGICNRYITHRYVKFGVSVAFGIGSYFAMHKTIALAGQFFASSIFTSLSAAVISRMPVVPVLAGAYARIAGAVTYAVPALMTKLLGALPVRIFHIVYQRAFGTDAIVQMGISKQLEKKVSNKKCTAEEAKELLEGGMKAYQVWMYLVEQGPQKGLFAKDH